jgi:hypothetical protein
MENNTRPLRKSYSIWIIIFIIVVILATLPFHYALDYGMIFPKEYLTFSNTFITREDVSKVLERYNNANFIEQQAIRQEPLARKLIEKGIIYDKKDEQQTSSEFALPRGNREFDYLKKLNGKYPYEVKLFEKTEFYQRLKKLLGTRCEFLINNFDVQIPIEIIDDFFVAEACQAHNCGYLGTEFIIVYDFSNDVMYIGIREDGEIKTYSENGRKSSIITEWEN